MANSDANTMAMLIGMLTVHSTLSFFLIADKTLFVLNFRTILCRQRGLNCVVIFWLHWRDIDVVTFTFESQLNLDSGYT